MQRSGPSTARWQIVVSLAIFAFLIVFAVLRGQPQQEIPFDLDSPGPLGLRALRLWLEEMDYNVERYQSMGLPNPPALLFIYPNEEPYSVERALVIRYWVEQGLTLVIIGPSVWDTALIDTFGVFSTPAQPFNPTIAQRQPLMPEANAQWFHFADRALDLSDAPNAVPLLADNEGEVLAAAQKLGKGIVWHLAPSINFTNSSLHETNNARLLIALLRTVPPGSTVAFDTYHLFGPDAEQGDEEIQSLQGWLYGTPTGWAILFVAAVFVLYLALQGTRLGPPLPQITSNRRREAAEFVEAMASLQRRARKRTLVAHHHKQRLKIALGRPLHLSPDLPDNEFVQRLRAADHRMTQAQLEQVAELLNGLNDSSDENKLVRLVARLDTLLNEIGAS